MSSPLQPTVEAGAAGDASNLSEAERRFLEAAVTCLKSPPEVSFPILPFLPSLHPTLNPAELPNVNRQWY